MILIFVDGASLLSWYSCVYYVCYCLIMVEVMRIIDSNTLESIYKYVVIWEYQFTWMLKKLKWTLYVGLIKEITSYLQHKDKVPMIST